MFKKTTLNNGLRIVVTPLQNTRAVTVLVLIGTGSKYEVKRINGISHLLEHMIFKGTKKRPNTLDIAKELDRVGGIYNAFTGKEFMGFWVKLDAKHFDLSCDVVSDMIFNSLFQSKELAREKKVIFEEINMIKDNPQGYVLDLWEELLYGDQPAGWMISGSKETLEKVSRRDVIDYFKSHFVAGNVVISIAGNLSAEKALETAKRFFGKFKRFQKPAKRSVVEKQTTPQVLVHTKKTDQAHLCLGVRAFDMFDKRRHALDLIAGILGGVMSSRLFIKIREQRGLAYYVRTMPEHYTDSGYLVTHAGVDTKKLPEVLEIILREYKDIKDKKVSKEELTKIKDNAKGHLYLGLETSDAWASYNGIQEILRGEISTPEKECLKIDKITQEDIMKVAEEIFQSRRLNLAATGPFKDKKQFQSILKKFEL
ncbi:MAG: hypothetical protein A3H01_02290 [Candidatus Wildermuthbacteria bacterium RIFCSPLOWO2_12_FULL_40_9]|uniref:Peptidase M16 n=2 Tax=Candidatus Wildermuthiibacteriota TaxID=1817923 RepID=A0A1G2RD80_9BACT|nr:MAG: hypothetical protein A3F15_01260 [Candidatus Wildermuthbacteria bacterium RIFCSPHIGHO2_12_FULL_40_12]OHA76924.1 MAG: hypothetical protein A3H01_02290 [Candidatus Wildermuthbacteria bacterium RIFCSPLOWO2_12_FULL_40_9]